MLTSTYFCLIFMCLFSDLISAYKMKSNIDIYLSAPNK